MANDENSFEVRLGRIDRDRRPILPRMRGAVRLHVRVPRGPKTSFAPKTGLRAHFRKGSARRVRPVQAMQRRVVVKARFATHGAGKIAPLNAHVRYLAREQKARERADPGFERSVDYLQRGETLGRSDLIFYDRESERLDAKLITSHWASDLRHFRLIISAEDGEALGDLKPMIREVMAGLEQKLGTKLEWLAIDHWDTDNPHTHVLLRGRTRAGEDLFIPSRIIRHGIREHAQEVVTRVLGPRLEADLRQERWREIGHLGVTLLDRQLVAAQDADGITAVHRPDLIARLERLEAWGLAARGAQGWRIGKELLSSLRGIAQHAEVERAVSDYHSGGERLPVLAAEPGQAVEGQLIHLGPADEFGDGLLAVIETGTGELRYQRFEREADMVRLRDVQPGAIIAFEPNVPEVRPSDRTIAAIAERTGGLYSFDHHTAETPGVSHGLVEANIRRLEALRRENRVSRTAEGVFIVGHDHLKRAEMYETRVAQRFSMYPLVFSYWSLDQQVQAIGPTRLDQVLAGEATPPGGGGGFARQYALALQQRRLFLIEQGWMQPCEPAPSKSAVARMAERELRGLANELSIEIGKPVLTARLSSVRGIYARRFDLAQGRVALIVGDRHASLVAWRPALERFVGRGVEGAQRKLGLTWRLSREIGLGIG